MGGPLKWLRSPFLLVDHWWTTGALGWSTAFRVGRPAPLSLHTSSQKTTGAAWRRDQPPSPVRERTNKRPGGVVTHVRRT